jgi:hypothetical protein
MTIGGLTDTLNQPNHFRIPTFFEILHSVDSETVIFKFRVTGKLS